MSAGDFRTPGFGDDDFLPDRRAWYALPLTVMYWALIFTIVYFATRNVAIEDSVAAEGYIGWLLITFILVIFFVIPAFSLFFGRIVDDATADLAPAAAAMRFALIGLIAGAIPGVFIYFVNNAYGWLPITQFLIPSVLAGALARLSIDVTLKYRAVRVLAVTFTTLVVVGSLGIGVLVFTGGI